LSSGASGDEEDEAGLGLDELGDLLDDVDGPEEVGLDDQAGVDDGAPLYDLDLPPDDAGAEPEGSVDVGVMIDDDLEGGWIDDGRAEDRSEWDAAELDLGELASLGADDGGEEGLDEAASVLLGDLPDLDGEGEEEPLEEAGLEAFMDTATMATMFAARVPTLPATIDPARLDIRQLIRGVTLRCLDAEVAGGEGLYRIRDGVRLDETTGIVGVAAVEAGRWLLATDGRVGETALPGEGPVTLFRDAASPTVWAHRRGGRLHHARLPAGELVPAPVDLPVDASTPSSAGGVLFVGGDRLVRSTEDFGRWSMVEAPSLGAPPWRLAAVGDAVAAGGGAGVFLSRDGGRRWSAIPGLPPVGAFDLAAEEGGLALYAAHPKGPRTVLARHRPDGGEGAVLVALEGEVHVVRWRGPGVVLVAGESGLHQIVIDDG
jgi:hypothetical protein